MNIRKSNSRKLVTGVAVASLALSLAACTSSDENEPGAADSVTIVFASYTDSRSGEMQQAQWWMDRVIELTDGAVNFEASYNASLVPAVDSFAAVQDGRIDAGYTAAFYTPAELPLSQVAGVPFLTSNAHAHSTAMDLLFEQNDAFKAEYLDNGVRPIFFIGLDSQAIGSVTPVVSVSDLKGLSIRAGGLTTRALDIAGAEAVAMGFDEVYQALERGVIDGYSSAQMSSAYASGLLEVAPYITNPGLGNYVASSFTINEGVWQALPEEIRAAMTQAALEFREEGSGILAKVSAEVCTSILADGGEVTVWSDDAVQEWRDLVGEDIVNEWIQTVVGAGVSEDDARSTYEQFAALIAQVETDSTFTNPMAACASGQ